MDIPGYKILETLGKGGMATVYLAIQESFDRKVAIKVMSAQLAQDPAFGDRFQREARIVSQMNHPNIVTVYDVGIVDNHHYLAMQFVDGKELRYRMGKMSLAEKIQAIKDVASALHYAGNKGYVHRDVKPENVMMSDEDGRAILMDFGIAKASDGNHSMTKTGMAIGTPYYMSPEQAQGKAVDHRSDIYSLGVMLFQLLTGYVPYDAESGVAIGIKHITEPVPLLPRHLRIFQPILEKVMAKDPARRYQSGAEVVDDLNKINIADLDKVDEIISEESQKIQTTDPHAHTVISETAMPPVLSTGNVTTADAQRLAARISAGEPPSPREKKNQSPFIGIAVMVAVLAGFFYFSQSSRTPEVATQAAPVAIAVAPTRVEPVVEPPVVEQKEEPSDAQANMGDAQVIDEEENAKLEAARIYQEEEAKKAAEIEAKRIKEAEAATIAAAEKAKAEKEKAEAEVRAAAKKADEKAAKVAKEKEVRENQEQARRDEISRRLTRAKELHESGALVLPEGDNAVLGYRSVLEIDPDNATATLALTTIESNYLLGIRTLIEQDQLDQAARQLKSAKRLYPDSVPINELLGLHQSKVAAKEAARVVATAPRISKVVVSEQSFDNISVDQRPVIPLGRSAFVGFSYENFQGATTLLQAVLYDSSRTVKIMQKPVVAAGAGGQIFFTLARPVDGFPDGGYTIDLMLNEERVASTSFKVSH